MKKVIRRLRFEMWALRMKIEIFAVGVYYRLKGIYFGMYLGLHVGTWIVKYTGAIPYSEMYELFDAWMEENDINPYTNPHEAVEDFKTWYITKVWAA